MTSSASGPELPTSAQLPVAADAVAPDGSLVRLLPSLASGSMAHFEGPTRCPCRSGTARWARAGTSSRGSV